MIPAWIIEELARQRREQPRRERPRLRIEQDRPVRGDDGPRPPSPAAPIVLEFGSAGPGDVPDPVRIGVVNDADSDRRM